jgi:hypothetical protein
VIRLLIWLVLVSLVLRSVVRVLRGIAEGMQGPSAAKPPKAVALARDPVCGTYVVPSNAYSLGTGDQMRFFCSEDCRRAYALKIAQ